MKEPQRSPHRLSFALLPVRFLSFCLAAVFALGALGGGAAAADSPAVDMRAGQERPGRCVIPLGRAVGIKLFSDGVLVVGLSDIPTAEGDRAPAKACGLREGDIITHINSEEVDSIEEVQEILRCAGDDTLSIRAMRDGKQLQMTAQAARCVPDGSFKLGAWIRDSMAGIGTVTFYDPRSGVFGALGHGINDVDTAQLMPLASGSIMYAEVIGVKKGAAGAPGELRGEFQVERDMGELYANTTGGVFGHLTDESLAAGGETVEIAGREQVKLGEVTILSNIAGDTVEPYAAEIVRIYPENAHDERDLMLKVTDPRLLERTGGIVQGMSGSPILQNGKLVGAVTHVLVNDPTAGYGILIENMLSSAESGA